MKYKIRITKAPDMMDYGGQLGYALDIAYRGNVEEGNDKDVSDTLNPVNRSDANIEAERGETIVGDFDNDGMNEHMKVNGKPHTEGGTPLNVPDGSFVFSNSKKLLIDGPVLSMFGKSEKKKYTPAQIAKQYDINKYKAILDDPDADNLSKSTAAFMIENYKEKLGNLALLQESIKGFPDGIPNISLPYIQHGGMAQYGGYFFGDGGEKKPKNVSKDDISTYEKQGYKRVPGTNIWRKESSNKIYGAQNDIIVNDYERPTTTKGSVSKGYDIERNKNYSVAGCSNLKYTIEDVNARPGCYNTFLNKQGFKYASDEEKLEGLKQLKRGVMPKYTKGTTDSIPISKTSIKKQCPPGYEYDVNAPDPNNPCVKVEQNVDEITYTDADKEENNSTHGDVVNNKKNKSAASNHPPFFGKQFAIGPKRYVPYAAPYTGYIPSPVYYDPNRELAEAASQRNMMSEYFSQLDPQTFSARASALNAQGAEQAAKTIGSYQNLNTGISNQYAAMQADALSKEMLYKADAADKIVSNSQQEDKAYRNAWRNYLNTVDRYNLGTYNYNTKKNMLNAVNPYYEIIDGPGGGNIVWRNNDWMGEVTGNKGMTNQTSSDTYEQAEKYALSLKKKGHDAASINMFLKARFPSLFSGQTKSSNNVNYMNMPMPYIQYNPYENMQMQYPQYTGMVGDDEKE